MRRLLSAALAACLLVPLAARADDAPAPLAGDLQNGRTRYRVDCASCHGAEGAGDGPLANQLNPHPAPLRDGAFLWSHTEAEILGAIMGQTPVPGAPPKAHAETLLTARDILTWLKQPIPEIGVVFPDAVAYIAHEQHIDSYGQQRASAVLGRDLTPSEEAVLVFVAYGRDPDSTVEPDGHPTKIPEDPASLYAAKPRRRLGYAVYQTLDLKGGPLDVLMAMDNDSRLVNVVTLPSPDPKVEHERVKLEKLLDTFVGSGGRLDKLPVAPHKRGVRAPRDVQTAMEVAFERLLEGDAMFQKEERNRFALDPDAFNFPHAEDQGNVKFQFKEQKGQ